MVKPISNQLLATYSLIVFGAFLAFFSPGSTTTADAQSNSNVCRQLNAQLANLSRGGGGDSRRYRQYRNAVRKQQNQLNKATRAARRNGCAGTRKNRNARCQRITSTISQMQVNLADLRNTMLQYAPNGARNSRERQAINRRLERNGCYSDSQIASAQQPERKSRRLTLLEQVFGVRTYNNYGGRQRIEINPNAEYSSRYGTFRTLCVRKTDGYYFPVSFSTVPERFDIDEQTCMNMCPNHDVGLYIHRMPQEDSEDMVSYRTDIPYRAEPFAFAYRKEHNREIQCRFSVADLTQSVDGTITNQFDEPEKEETPRIGIPRFRKDPSDIPDAYDNEIAGMNWKEAQAYMEQATRTESVIAGDGQEPKKNIRIVGPAFFPVQ